VRNFCFATPQKTTKKGYDVDVRSQKKRKTAHIACDAENSKGEKNENNLCSTCTESKKKKCVKN